MRQYVDRNIGKDVYRIVGVEKNYMSQKLHVHI